MLSFLKHNFQRTHLDIHVGSYMQWNWNENAVCLNGSISQQIGMLNKLRKSYQFCSYSNSTHFSNTVLFAYRNTEEVHNYSCLLIIFDGLQKQTWYCHGETTLCKISLSKIMYYSFSAWIMPCMSRLMQCLYQLSSREQRKIATNVYIEPVPLCTKADLANTLSTF